MEGLPYYLPDAVRDFLDYCIVQPFKNPEIYDKDLVPMRQWFAVFGRPGNRIGEALMDGLDRALYHEVASAENAEPIVRNMERGGKHIHLIEDAEQLFMTKPEDGIVERLHKLRKETPDETFYILIFTVRPNQLGELNRTLFDREVYYASPPPAWRKQHFQRFFQRYEELMNGKLKERFPNHVRVALTDDDYTLLEEASYYCTPAQIDNWCQSLALHLHRLPKKEPTEEAQEPEQKRAKSDDARIIIDRTFLESQLFRIGEDMLSVTRADCSVLEHAFSVDLGDGAIPGRIPKPPAATPANAAEPQAGPNEEVIIDENGEELTITK
jgi:hypothetical protein